MSYFDPMDSKQALDDSKQAIRNGLRDQARTLAARSTELDPQNEEAWLILAALTNPAESIEYLKTALRINPNSERARRGMQWAEERLRKEEIQNQFLAMVKKTKPLSPRPIQEYSHPKPDTLVQDQLSPIPDISIQDHSHPVNEAGLWHIDVAKILSPDKNVFEFVYNGFFTAYHQISITGTKMGEIHPHTYRLQIRASTELVTRNNQIIVSYETIHSVVDRICKAYEGKTLNDLPPFINLQPSTENLVGVIAQQLEKLSSGKQYKIYEVTLMESPTVGVVYKNMDIIRTFH
jgi:6-pyruvoyltetrahydropterin/6-carboxytetrahydropterin synthase